MIEMQMNCAAIFGHFGRNIGLNGIPFFKEGIFTSEQNLKELYSEQVHSAFVYLISVCLQAVSQSKSTLET
jgi:hypothetical protein